jgi:hypothetical protein
MLHFPAEGRPNPVEGIRPPSLPPRSERLVEPVAGTLKTKHGRIFATIPRSTSQTSPRRGLAIVSLSCVQVEEHLLRDGDETIVTDIPRFALHHLPEEQTCSLMFFRVAEQLE